MSHDDRPTADDLSKGWRLRSRLDRVEVVERVERTEGYLAIKVWTDQTGPDYFWVYPRWEKVTATPPEPPTHGDPEIRVIESWRGDGPMYAVATRSAILRPDTFNALVTATTAGRSQPWKVTEWRGDTPDITEFPSKAAARSALRRAARAHARALGVKLVLPSREAPTT